MYDKDSKITRDINLEKLLGQIKYIYRDEVFYVLLQ